jgi:chromosome segregation ATPase
MAVQRRPAPSTPIDLEETAELPVLDMAAMTGTSVMPEISEDSLSVTDEFARPGLLPIGVAEMAENLRDVEDRLHRKAERLATLERELEQARTSERSLRETLERSSTEAHTEAARISIELLQLTEKNRIASARLGQLEQALREREQTLATQNRDLDTRALQISELSSTAIQISARETALVGERDALHARSSDLAQQLAQRAEELAAERNALATQAATLRGRDAQCLRLEVQLTDAVARTERQMEALRSAEGYRAISEGLIAEREDEIRLMEQQVVERDALADAARADTAQRDQQIAGLEQQLSQAMQQIAEHAERIAGLVADLAARDKRVADLERAQTAAERNAEARSEALRVASDHTAEINSMLAAEKLHAGKLATDLAAAQETLAQQQRALRDETERLKVSEQQHASAAARSAQLDGQLAAEAARGGTLAAELDALRGKLSAEQQAAAAQAGEFATREQQFAQLGEREKAYTELLEDQQETIGKLQSELLAIGERATRFEEDLRAAEAQISRVEGDLRHRDSRVDELTRGAESLQLKLTQAEKALAESQEQVHQMESDAHANAAVLGNIQQSIQRLGREDSGARPAVVDAPLESLARLFVRQDAGSEVVHVLTRRTTIGRTPDNDIQIDTSFVSRHHAVVLASTKHTIVEDLNSTNGVLVNGRRVNRQPLHDGDLVQIGKTEFRYQLKPLGHTGNPS